jgi:hypothetical protein
MAKSQAKTLVSRIQESRKATNIYLTNEVALYLAARIKSQAGKNTGIRVVILNKDDRPDIQVFAYPVKK